MSSPVTTLGLAYGRYGNRPFGIHLADRMQHVVLFGQTGAGKSTLIGQMARQDAEGGLGVCLLDPHGDLAEELAQALPDALYWDVADPSSPYGYNPLTRTSASLRPLVTSGLIQSLKKQWTEAWGVRMEHLLRHAILALLDQPRTDMSEIMQLFLDRSFRKAVVQQIEDPQVAQFWQQEFPAMNYKTAFDGVAPIANKLGAFLSHPVMRQALCDPAEPLRLRQIMDSDQSLIVNLGKGRLGADNANLIGGLLVSAITNAAYSRQGVKTRRPFMLYIDEFHSFTTEALADTLSETRKYGLSLTLAAQHCRQASPDLLAGILGNIGTLISFRLGALDAPIIARQLGNVTPEQLTKLPNYQTLVSLMVDGEKTAPFSAGTIGT